MRRAIGVAASLLVVVGLPHHVEAQTAPSFKFDFEGGSASTLTRPQSGLIQIRLLYTKGKDKDGKIDESLPTQVRVVPSLFASESGSVTVHASNGPCDPRNPPSGAPAPFALRDTIQDLCLYVAALPSEGKYSGNLVIASEKTEPVARAVAISRSAVAPATTLLVSGPNRVDLTLWNPFASGSAPPFVITLQERTGKTPVEGLFVKMEVVSSPSGYDLKKVGFRLNGVDADLAVMKADDAARRIFAGGQSKVEVTLDDLHPGEYNLVFRFAGINTGTDDTQKLTVPVRVRHHWAWAVLLLFAASLVSFIANKVITAKKRRFALLRRIGELCPQWLTTFGQILPVVWIRATLDLAEKLSKRFWLTGPDEIDRRVNEVSNHLKVLERARHLRARLESTLHALVFRKVDRKLVPTISALGQTALDAAALEKFETELEEFEEWLNKDTFATTLWADVEHSLRRVQANIQADPKPPTTKVFAGLKARLDAALLNPPTTAATAEDAYLTYAKLQTLWVVRNHPETFDKCERAESLITTGSFSTDLDGFFNIADKYVWGCLKKHPLQIKLPDTSDPDGFEAFTPLRFSVDAPGADVDETYLFKYRIEYEWSFTFRPHRWHHRASTKPDPQAVPVKSRTLAPSVMQFFSRPGLVEVSADMTFLGDRHSLPRTQSLVIGRSREFGVMNAFERAELLSWGVALALAIFSGLSIYYVSAAGWGGFKDYLTLFLWGAGMETGKTFLQAAAAK